MKGLVKRNRHMIYENSTTHPNQKLWPRLKFLKKKGSNSNVK
jgi:hypothetical protein